MLWHKAMLAALIPHALMALAPTATSQNASRESVVGKWDLTVQKPDGNRPSWVELHASGRSALVGRFVGEVGSARPVAHVHLADGLIRFAIPAQWETGDGDLRFEGRLDGDNLTGSLTYPDGKRFPFKGVRAPSLRREKEPQWGDPIRLIANEGLAGWRVVGGQNRWRVADGVLHNAGSGGNLVTERTFGDFKLHLEFRYPKGSNSGVYLRGRYEVQIADSVPAQPMNDLLGAVYGFLAPSEVVQAKPDEWQTFDITLVGRMLTVVANGKTVICNQEIPGPTGGALDSNEGAPGPLMLQGDHGVIEYRNVVVTPAR
ncbi:MAG: DUF1080 domain-containing protein [Gemmatimonadota bacterium]|nr:DUF1080 domain-containing protein [Gemmatimonadota bacterium]